MPLSSKGTSMSCLASARLVFFDSLATLVSPSLRRPRSSLRSLYSSFSTSTTTTTRWPLRRRFSIMADSGSALFNYTSGRWMYVSYMLSCLSLTRNLTYSVSTMLFAMKSADGSSTSTGYLDSRQSLSTAVFPHHHARQLPTRSAYPVSGYGAQVLRCR